jgi:O-antigen/teichoic acid export membrane protein
VSAKQHRSTTASAAVITYGTNLAVAVLSLANVLVVSRTLGPGGRGSVAFLTAVAWFTSSIASAGVEEANANFAASEPNHRRALATNSLALALLLGALATGVIATLMKLVPAVAGPSSTDLRWLTLALVPVLILNLYLRWLVRADYAFAVVNIATLVPPIGNVTINCLFAAVGMLTVGTAVMTWLAGQAAGTLILAWYVARRQAGFGRPSLALMRRTLGFGLKTHAGRVMLLGNYRLDQWLLGAISGARELGLYSVAVAWGEALLYLPTALKFVQRPNLVRAGPREAARQTAVGFRAALVVTTFLGLAMVAAAPILCATLFGAKFHGSIVELRLLVPSAAGALALTVFGNALVAQRRPVLSSIALGIGFVCTITLDVALIPKYAGVGAAIASTAAYTVAGVVMGVFFLRALGGKPKELIPTGDEGRWFLEKARRMRSRAYQPVPLAAPTLPPSDGPQPAE